MLNVRQNLLDPAKYYLKSPYTMKYEYVCIHNTANDAPAINEVKYMVGNSSSTSFHYAVDDVEIVQGIPDDRNAYHAGDGDNGTGNRKALSIEICYSLSGGDRFIKAEKLAAKFAAEKIKAIGKDINALTKHQDYSGKYCPHRTLDMGWDRFKAMVQTELDALNKAEALKVEQEKLKLDRAQQWAVDNGILANKDWDKPMTKSQVAWAIYTAKKRGLI